MEVDPLSLLPEGARLGPVPEPDALAMLPPGAKLNPLPTPTAAPNPGAINAVVRRETGADAAPSRANVFDEPGPGYGHGLSEAVINGLTFGLNDEARAVGGGLAGATRGGANWLARQIGVGEPYKDMTSFGEGYDTTLAQRRQDARDFADENPVSDVAAQLFGGLVATPAGAIVKAAQTPAQLVLNSGRVGAGMGMASGFGNAEGGVGERLRGAAEGGVIGGAIGTAAPVALPYVAKLINYPVRLAQRAVEPFTQAGQERAAGRILTEAAGSHAPTVEAGPVAGMTPTLGQATNNPGVLWLERSAQQGSPEAAALADKARTTNNKALVDAIGSLGDVEAGAAPAAGAEMRAAVQRATPEGTAGERAAADLADTLGTTGATHDIAADLSRQQRSAAAPLFDEAFAVGPVHSDRLGQFTADPIVQQGIRKGIRTEQLEALADGRPFQPHEYGITGFNEAGDPILGGVPTMRQLAAGKRGLDDILEGYRDKTTGKLVLDEHGRAIDAVRRSYLTELKTLNPKYGDALAAWSGPAQSRDALYAGRNIFKPDAEITAQRIAKMTDGDKQFFREGVTRAVQDLVDNTAEGADALTKFLGKPAMREKLQAAFPSPEAYQAFETRALGRIESKPVADTLAHDMAGAPKIADSGVADQFIRTGKGAPEALNGYLKKVGNDAAGLQAARDAFARKFLDEVSSVQPDREGARFVLAGKTNNFIKDYEHVIDSRLFTNDQRALIRAVGKGADMANRTARAATPGGSDTYGKLAGGRFVDAMIGTVPSKILSAAGGAVAGGHLGGPVGAILGAREGGTLVEALYAAPRQKIVALVDQSLHDPELAKSLMMKATPKAFDMMPSRVRSALVGVLGTGAIAGASSGRN